MLVGRGAGEAGVTIVELSITTALLMVVLLAVFNSFDTVSKSQAFQADRSVIINDMRGVLNQHDAGAPPGDGRDPTGEHAEQHAHLRHLRQRHVDDGHLHRDRDVLGRLAQLHADPQGRRR